MSDLIVGVAVVLLALVVVVLPAVLVARWQDRRQASARHCLRRPHPAVVLARDLLGLLPPAPAPATWDRIRAGMRAPRYVDTSRTLAETFEAEDGPIGDGLTEDEAARMDAACTALRPIPMSPDPEAKPFTGWQVPDDWRLPGGRGLMFTRPGKQPWLTGTMPAIPAPEPSGPDRAWDPGDGLGPQVPIARPYAPSPTWGEACQLDVAEAERQFAMLALGPDGCEET